MDTALLLAFLWFVFGTTHVLLSSQTLRPKLVAALGAQGFLGAYSVLALAIFIPLVAIYLGNRHAGPYLGSGITVPGMRVIMYVVMGIAFSLVVGGLVRQSPASVVPGDTEVRGVFHVTRHPLFMGFALFGAMHLCVVALHASDLAFFAGFPIFGLIGTAHQDARKWAEGGDAYRGFHEATSWLPNPAGIPAAIREQPVPVAIGIALTVGLRWLHPVMFGGGA